MVGLAYNSTYVQIAILEKRFLELTHQRVPLQKCAHQTMFAHLVFEHTASYFTIDDAKAACSVCRGWRDYLYSSIDWRKPLENFLKNNIHVSELEKCTPSRFKKITKINLKNWFSNQNFVLIHCPNLTSLKLSMEDKQSGDIFEKLPKYLPNLQKLCVCIPLDSFLADIANLPKLRHLSITLHKPLKHVHISQILEKCKSVDTFYAYLSSSVLSLDLLDKNELFFRKLKKFGVSDVAFMNAVWQRFPNIRKLKVHDYDQEMDVYNNVKVSGNVPPSLYNVPEIISYLLSHAVHAPKLQKLYIEYTNIERFPRMENLRVFCGRNIDASPSFLGVLSMSCPLLEEIKISNNGRQEEYSDLEQIIHLPRLHTLELEMIYLYLNDVELRATALNTATFKETHDRKTNPEAKVNRDVHSLPKLVASLQMCPKLKCLKVSASLVLPFSCVSNATIIKSGVKFEEKSLTSGKAELLQDLKHAGKIHRNIQIKSCSVCALDIPSISETSFRNMIQCLGINTQKYEGLLDVNCFANLQELYIFGADVFTSTTLLHLSENAKHLKTLSMSNNHNPEMTCLHLESTSLISFEIIHFHQLETSLIKCPNLCEITLDNSGKVMKGQKSVTAESSFCERALRTLCEESSCPSLLRFYGYPTSRHRLDPKYDTALDPVDLDVSHPTLVSLWLCNCTNMVTIKVRCPKLEDLKLRGSDCLTRLVIDCPKLHYLAYDNCDKLTTENVAFLEKPCNLIVSPAEDKE